MFEFIIRKTYVHCLRYRTYAIRFAIGAFVTEMRSAGASADDLAPCREITGEIGWLTRERNREIAISDHYDLIIYGYREVDSERQFRIFPRYIRPLFIRMLVGTVGKRSNELLVANVVLVERGLQE